MSDKADGHTIAVLSQLVASGYFPYLRNVELHNSKTVRFVISQEGLDKLVWDADDTNEEARFQSGILYGYHRDVGKDLIDFRSLPKAFGKGCLQFVIDRTTLAGYADVDRFSPYVDLVGWFGHTGEVIGSWFGRRHT